VEPPKRLASTQSEALTDEECCLELEGDAEHIAPQPWLDYTFPAAIAKNGNRGCETSVFLRAIREVLTPWSTGDSPN
jgi:hypothetical protein